MLTIKVIRPDGKKHDESEHLPSVAFSEFIEEAKTVFYNTAVQSASGHPSVSFFKDNGMDGGIDVYEGTVYVMNEAGATIAKYDLGYGFNWPATGSK